MSEQEQVKLDVTDLLYYEALLIEAQPVLMRMELQDQARIVQDFKAQTNCYDIDAASYIAALGGPEMLPAHAHMLANQKEQMQ